MHHFSRTLRDELRRRGKSVYFLAEYTGYDPSFLHKIVAGKKRPSLKTLIRLSEAVCADSNQFKEDPLMAQTLDRLLDALLADATDELN